MKKNKQVEPGMFGSRQIKIKEAPRRDENWPKVPRMFQNVGLITLSAITLVFLLAAQTKRFGWCLSQQQRQLQSTERNSIGQVPYGSEYSIISDNLLNSGQPAFNSKRARKVSAFMPMRGRKDGRNDRQHRQNEQDFEDTDNSNGELLLVQPFKEADDDSSILNLVTASLAAVSPEPRSSFQVRWLPASRKFLDQFAVRHMLVDSDSAPRLQSGALESVEQDQFKIGGGDSASVMQAKLRRAFHPMRGKKFDQGQLVTFPDEMLQVDD